MGPRRARSRDAIAPSAGRASAGGTTTDSPATDLAWSLAGFVVAEGCFTSTGDSSRFTFSVGLGASDSGRCDALRRFLGVGTIVRSPRRQPHHDDQVQFCVQSIHDLIGVVVPFMDEHLPPSYKRQQYLE